MRATKSVAVCVAAAGLYAAEPGWRFRTTVSRSAPYRQGVARPVEAVVDFPALIGRAGEFDPASVRVMEHGAGRELPYAWRSEFDARRGRAQQYLTWFGTAGRYDIYFDTRERRRAAPRYSAAELPPENLASWEWQAAPAALVRPGRPLRIVVDETTPPRGGREVSLAQSIDVRRFAGQEMVFECDLVAERAAYGAPVTVELEQRRADGSRIQEYAVPPRWLTVELAQGQLVRFSERGRFSPDAVTLLLRLRFRCEVKDADTGETVGGPESYFHIRLDRVVVRPGERWMWPEASNAGFVEGALLKAPLNRAFLFTGQRRLAFNGASEGSMQAGVFHPDPKADHWGLQAGTLEFWCRPLWNAGDKVERVLYDAVSYGHRLHSRMRKLEDGGLEFSIADAGGTLRTVRGAAPLIKDRWHHLAATWDFPRAQLQLFVDGKRVGRTGPESAPWPASLVAVGGPRQAPGIGIEQQDTRSIPIQAFIGGDQKWAPERGAEAAIDEFRVSDVARYTADFSPPREEFATDEHTRALFHFENERDGVHGGDDRFVRGYLACELEPQREDAPLEVFRAGAVERRTVVVKPHASREKFETSRAENRLQVTRPARELPDPRFVEYRERRVSRVVTGSDDGFVLNAGGDWAPLLRSLTFRAEAGAAVPHWRSEGQVLPFTPESLRRTLATGARTDREKAVEVFRYALATTNYFDNEVFSEIMPNGRVRRSVAYTFLKALNIYPWSQCGPLNYTLRKLFLTMGLSSTNAPGTHHQYQQVFFDGSLRLFDLMPRIYWLERDNQTAASLRGIREDPHLKLRQGGDLNMWLPGRVERASFGTAERPHDMTFNLRAGETASLCWHNEGRWFELGRGPVSLARIPPYYGNGAILYAPGESSEAAALENMTVRGAALRARDAGRTASLTYRLLSPYILSDGRATGRFTGAVSLSFSVDEGHNWTPVWRSSTAEGRIEAALLPHVAGRYAYWLKLEMAPGAAVDDFRVRTTLVASPLALPLKLERGANHITFVGKPAAPVTTECRWVERYKTAVGVGVEALSYYMDGDASHRNVILLRPGGEGRVAVTVQGGPAAGRVRLEGLPPGMLAGPAERPAAAAVFPVRAAASQAGDVVPFEIVLGERRVPAQILVAGFALAAEAESARQVSGDAKPVQQAGASAGRAMAFGGEGKLEFALSPPKNGAYTLWLHARWQGRETPLSVQLDGGPTRLLRAAALIGLSDWTDSRRAYTKMYAFYGEQFGEWAWYRVPDLDLSSGAHALTLGAAAGAQLDAVVVLPQTPATERAAVNLFQNWNYAPWENPL